MPQKIKDAEGKEHEVYTQQEIDEMVNTKTKEKDEALSKLNNELETLKKGDGKQDWAATRTLIKDLEGKIETLTKERDADKQKFAEDLRSVRTSTFSSTVEAMMKGLSAGDEEVAKKIKHHYDRLATNVQDENQAAEVMKDAFLLATGKQAPNPLAVARGFNGGGAPVQREQVNQQVSELGRKFGISDEEVKKYGDKAAQKKQGI